MPGHQVELGLAVVMVVMVMMIVVSKQVRLVFRIGVRRYVRYGLHCLCQTNKIELVCVTFTVYLRHDVFVVVVTQGATQLVVIHVRLALSFAPTAGDLIRVNQLELSVRTLPGDVGSVGTV